MKALIDFLDSAAFAAVEKQFDNFVEVAGHYYLDHPRKVIPEWYLGSPTFDELEISFRAGIRYFAGWEIWTRSSGTVVAIHSDHQRRLLVAGRRHSIVEVLPDGIPARWEEVASGRYCWQSRRGNTIASPVFIQTKNPEADPLKPV